VLLPGTGGFEATATVREAERRSGSPIPVTAMTAHIMAGDHQRCLEAGITEYVAKPIPVHMVFEAIAEVCSAERLP